LGRVLGQDVAVGLLDQVAESDVQLLLSWAPLPLGALHRHTARVEGPHDRADERLFLRPLEDVVVLDVGAERLEVAVSLAPRRLEALAKDVHFELRPGPRPKAHLVGPKDLAREEAARRDLDRPAVAVPAPARNDP